MHKITLNLDEDEIQQLRHYLKPAKTQLQLKVANAILDSSFVLDDQQLQDGYNKLFGSMEIYPALDKCSGNDLQLSP